VTSFLDVEARLDGTFLHPGGRALTDVLLAELNLAPGQMVLEIGCGTGVTAAIVAGATGATVVAVERSPLMMRRAREKARDGVHLVQADANCPLPFRNASFDALYVESVMALLDLDVVLPECARVLRPGGRLVLTERIWKPGLTRKDVAIVNDASRQAFGIPAATSEPLDRDGWLRALEQSGFVEARATQVDTLLPPQMPRAPLTQRVARGGRYLGHPSAIMQSARFKLSMRRQQSLWASLESYLFLARKPDRDGSRARCASD
jgi:SAM-dependent methyltransferase